MHQSLKARITDLVSNRQFINISLAFLFRGGNILCNFLIVPLLIDQLSVAEYGILITIISISTWFAFVDFGLANGLKNKISESLALGDVTMARKYITAGYSAMFKVVLALAIILALCNYFIDWNQILKGPSELQRAINLLFFYGLLLFFSRILVELINPVLLAYHKTAISSLLAFITQFIILGTAFILKRSGDHSFLHYGFLFFIVPLLVYGLSSVYFYSSSLKHIKPARGFSEKKYESALFKLGGSFFIIQLAYLVVFTTDNLIVGRLFGYQEVSNYNIAYRFFNIPILIITIVLTPYWPILAESFVNKETDRIKSLIRKLLILWVAMIALALVMLLVAPTVYRLWVGEKINIDFILNLGMFTFCIMSVWSTIFMVAINSTSRLRLQLYSCIFTGLLNIPLAVYLAKHTSLGPAGVIFSSSICLLPGAIWGPIQLSKLINNKATGIWNK